MRVARARGRLFGVFRFPWPDLEKFGALGAPDPGTPKLPVVNYMTGSGERAMIPGFLAAHNNVAFLQHGETRFGLGGAARLAPIAGSANDILIRPPSERGVSFQLAVIVGSAFMASKDACPTTFMASKDACPTTARRSPSRRI